MSKKLKFDLILNINAGQVTAGPPIATSLGPKGVPLGLLAKELNDKTASFTKGAQVRSRIKIYDDKTYDATILGATTRQLLFAAANVNKGANTPGNQTVGTITMAQVEQIASEKGQSVGSILGTAKSSGIQLT